MTGRIVKRIKEADGAHCESCDKTWDRFTNQALPWDWSHSKGMHERGTGHRVILFAYSA